jgi:D-3-phosphoglycerate dehydrogenase
MSYRIPTAVIGVRVLTSVILLFLSQTVGNSSRSNDNLQLSSDEDWEIDTSRLSPHKFKIIRGSCYMYTFLVTAPSFAAPGLAKLQEAGCRVFYAKDESELANMMVQKEVDAVISRTITLSGDVIRSAKNLKVISKHGAGYNNVDVDAATERGIPVFYTPGANSQSVAELTIGLAMAVARSIPLHDRTLRNGGWSRSEMGIQLSGRTMGVVGLGNIGQKVARLGAAFGMRVLGFDPKGKPMPCEKINSLVELLPQAQILTLHCPLNDETRGMIGAVELNLLPKNAIVLNTARGGIVDEIALAEAIKSGRIFGAGIDDFVAEPVPADHPFNALSRVVMTPHIGASTQEALDIVSVMSAENALMFLHKQPFDKQLCVNPSVLRNQITMSAQ